ncbi:hypothetical protein ACP4OV_005539 [Aristida adscensionis]
MIPGVRLPRVVDSRGSLLLLALCLQGRDAYADAREFPHVLVVCEPLTRRCRRIPPPRGFVTGCRYEQSYLIDGDDDRVGSCIGMSNFKVLCEFSRRGVPLAAVFNAGGGGDGEDSWRERSIGHIVPRIDHTRRILGPSGGYWYFYVRGTGGVVLDGRTGEYSPFALPASLGTELQDDPDLRDRRWNRPGP